MRYLVCPQCGISNFYVKNHQGEKLIVKVSGELDIVPVDKLKNLEAYNLEILYCLGCSWQGKVSELKNILFK